MKNQRKYLTITAGVVLLLSLGINCYLATEYVDRNRRLNVMWGNEIVQFIQVADWAHFRMEDVTQGDVPISHASIEHIKTNIIRVDQQIEGLGVLAYGGEIFTFEQQQKLRAFLSYQNKVFDSVLVELDTKGEVSKEKLDQIGSITRAWAELLVPLQQQTNEIKLFQPFFQKGKWKQVWIEAMNSFESVELVPLD